MRTIGVNVISVATVLLNFVLQFLMYKIVNRIGLKSTGDKSMQMCKFVFISQFINTGLIGLLSNADFENTFLNFIPINRKYSDFSENWYIDQGTLLTQTMCIQSVMPYVNIAVVILISKMNKF